MIQLYASVAIGTAASVLATLLLLLRTEFQGRRPVLALTRLWIATSKHTSALILALLGAIAVSCFATLPETDEIIANSTSGISDLASSQSTHDAEFNSDESSSATQALQALRSYADTMSAKPQPGATTSSPPSSGQLPAVDMMISKLVARLEKQPDDVKGWKMLGWSYLNMDRPEQAAKAYQTALKLAPNDDEIQKGLAAAKSPQSVMTQDTPFDPAPSPTAEDIKAAESLPEAQRYDMIRGMVDQLATRLATAPNDEDGWLRLMRSRMTLGEKAAAKTALTKALETFASDAAAKVRLTAAARDLGVESD